ncbi:MAG TPA: TIGR03067 domain-containing protein [Candidatus Sulfotelmatobacter sp.]|nr:TIGR03067 domain-containing protein [Candidatus Sulfotelmatobacter sp.]
MSARLRLLLLIALVVPGCKSYSLPGHWSPVSAQLGGADFPVSQFEGATLQLTKNSYEFGGDKGTIEIIRGPLPAQMDIHGKEGPNAGKTIPAIYLVEGDFLTVCYQLGTGDRPKDFVSPPGTKVLLIHYKRIP